MNNLGVKIRVDANQGFSPKAVLRFIGRIKEFNVEFVEEPVPSLGERSEVPIIADEGAHLAKDVLTVVEYNAVDGINIKLMKRGGISGAIKIIHVAEGARIPRMVGCMLESRIFHSCSPPGSGF